MTETLWAIALAVALTAGAVALGWLFWRRLRTDAGRVADGFLLLVTAALAVAAVLAWAGVLGASSLAVVGVSALVALLPLVVLVVAAALVFNGVRVMRREGIGLTTALPAAGGAALVLVPLGTLFALSGAASVPVWVAAAAVAASLLSLYLGVHLLAYGAYAIAYARMPVPKDSRVVVTLGAGLRGDRVTPLLAGRLDRALAVRAASDDPDAVLMVTSGGQGPDEVVSEAEAMARYLLEQGVPESAILREDRSTTTNENLRFTRELLAERGLGDAGVVVSTNDFHAVRTAAIARRQGWRGVRVVGSTTASYYRPAAALREFVALLQVNQRRHAVVTALIVLGVTALAWLTS